MACSINGCAGRMIMIPKMKEEGGMVEEECIGIGRNTPGQMAKS